MIWLICLFFIVLLQPSSLFHQFESNVCQKWWKFDWNEEVNNCQKLISSLIDSIVRWCLYLFYVVVIPSVITITSELYRLLMTVSDPNESMNSSCEFRFEVLLVSRSNVSGKVLKSKINCVLSSINQQTINREMMLTHSIWSERLSLIKTKTLYELWWQRY